MLSNENLDELFSYSIDKARKKYNINENPYAEAYLTSVLKKFIGENPDIQEKIITFYAFEKFAEGNIEELIKMGDEILFTTGFFSEKLTKDKKRKYLINVGQEAYHNVSQKFEGPEGLYKTLCYTFEGYSNVINNVKYNILEKADDETLFKILNTWNETGNENAFEKLKDCGLINPN